MLAHGYKLLTFLLLLIGINIVYAIDEVENTESDGARLAIIDTDYNIATYDLTSETLTQLTDDGANDRRYQWATWSTDGRLAYFCCEATGALPTSQIFVSSNGVTTPELLYETEGEFIIYASWSPADCGTDCREVAILANNLRNGTLAVDIIEDSTESTVTRLGTGSPFYFHWNATGSDLIFHRNNSQLDIHTRAQNDISASLSDSSGTFQTPVWSPIDSRVLVGVRGAERGTTDLVIIDGDDTTTLVSGLEGLVSFLWSPDGSKIAYRTVDQFGINNIIVVDANTGEEISASDVSGAVAFFWSPDSTRIAFITIEGTTQGQNATLPPIAPETPFMQRFVQDDSPTALYWNVLDVETGANVRYSPFIPTFEMTYLLTYFDQFAPSHRVWSPDSNYLVYTGFVDRDSQPEPFVYIQDVSDNSIAPQSITEGVFSVWSFE
ncbi:MAG: hypothetical protein AAFR81_14360 [Chloroflexota bacterium]